MIEELAIILFNGAEDFWRQQQAPVLRPPRTWEHASSNEREYWKTLASSLLLRYELRRK